MTSPRSVQAFGLGLVLAIAAISATWLHVVWAQDLQKKVLVLYATRRDAQIVSVGERELPRILADGLEGGLDYFSEYIDRARFPDALDQRAFQDFLRLKYRDVQFDLVIAMQELALDFVGRNRNELFPGVPVVFFANTSSTHAIDNSTGVVANLNLAGSIALAAELHPDLRNVFVVSGANVADHGYEEMARTQLRPFESRLKITYLTGLVARDLESRLATLPAHSLIYYLVVDQDGAGTSSHPLEYLDRLAAVANAPIYCWVDSAIDHGIVGGRLKSQAAEVDAVGTLALRILRGEQASSIPVQSVNITEGVVDWRQLRRWNINEARLPAGTRVLFRQPSVWDSYRGYILASAGVVLAQTLLIVGLLVQRRHRRQAEEQVRGSQAELRTSNKRVHDLGARLLNAQESERARIARELHDDISQQVALLSIDLELLGRDAQSPSDRLAGEALSRTHAIARSVHDLSHRLHPAKLRLIGLVAALQGLQHELSQSGIAIGFTHDNVPPTLPPDLTLCFFRVAQESLQNAVKHSGARQISLHLGGGPEGLALTVTDDGTGFDLEDAWDRGLGLISMGERLDAIGGTFEIRSAPGAGTRVQVAVPLVPENPTFADFA